MYATQRDITKPLTLTVPELRQFICITYVMREFRLPNTRMIVVQGWLLYRKDLKKNLTTVISLLEFKWLVAISLCKTIITPAKRQTCTDVEARLYAKISNGPTSSIPPNAVRIG